MDSGPSNPRSYFTVYTLFGKMLGFEPEMLRLQAAMGVLIVSCSTSVTVLPVVLSLTMP